MKKILIADDEPHVSLVLKQFLERSGYQVLTVLNGKQALKLIKSESIDILITDVQMPIMNGIQLCEKIEQELQSLKLVIIMMTSRTDNEIRTWAESYSHITLVEKPLSMRSLVTHINNCFKN